MDSKLCPAPEELSGFVFGTIQEKPAMLVADHVEQCSECDATVESLEAGSDTVVEKLRRPAPQDPYLEESGFKRTESLVSAIGREL